MRLESWAENSVSSPIVRSGRSCSLQPPASLQMRQVVNLVNKPNRKLEQEPWFHGVRALDDVRKEFTKRGDYLVRLTNAGNKMEVMLNLKSDGGIDQFRIVPISGSDKYALRCLYDIDPLRCNKFSSISSLIEYYSRHRLPNKLRLGKGICRPSWLLSSSNIEYTEKQKLGSGNFCVVYRGDVVRHELNGRRVRLRAAIKVCSGGADADRAARMKAYETRKSMIDEAKLIAAYSHQHIVRLHGVACDIPPVVIALEFCSGGALISHLQKVVPDSISNTERVQYSLEMALGMQYLHSQNCIHRDLAARNVLISMSGKMKIADFGLSKVLRGDGSILQENLKEAPIAWMAPESIAVKMIFSFATDMWTFGVVLYEVWTNGAKPWAVEDDDRVLIKKLRSGTMPEFPTSAPTPILDLVKRIWVVDPKQRPSFDDNVVKDLMAIREKMPPLSDADWKINHLKGVKRNSAAGGGAAQDNPLPSLPSSFPLPSSSSSSSPLLLPPLLPLSLCPNLTDSTSRSFSASDRENSGRKDKPSLATTPQKEGDGERKERDRHRKDTGGSSEKRKKKERTSPQNDGDGEKERERHRGGSKKKRAKEKELEPSTAAAAPKSDPPTDGSDSGSASEKHVQDRRTNEKDNDRGGGSERGSCSSRQKHAKYRVASSSGGGARGGDHHREGGPPRRRKSGSASSSMYKSVQKSEGEGGTRKRRSRGGHSRRDRKKNDREQD